MPNNTQKIVNKKSDVTHTNPKKDKDSKIELFCIILGVCLVCAAWFFYPKFLNQIDSSHHEQKPKIVIPYQVNAMLITESPPIEIEEEKTQFQRLGDLYGTYGDSYGSLNTLFSGLAFTFLVASLILQRKELHAQRLEIQDQKDEIIKSNAIADQQRQIAANQEVLISSQLSEGQKQNFYNLLFKFLDEKNNRFSRLKINPKLPNGGDEFMKIYSEALSKSIADLYGAGYDPEIMKQNNMNALTNKYHEIARYYAKSFEDYSYFEYFISILNFIKKNALYNQDETVTQIFLSNLTKHETICLAYYAVLKNPVLFEYIEKFSLLRNLDYFQMPGGAKQNLKSLYNEQAFTPEKRATLDDFLENH